MKIVYNVYIIYYCLTMINFRHKRMERKKT